MNWNTLNTVAQLNILKEESFNQPVLLFKHSPRCNISAVVLNRMERHWKQEHIGDIKPFYLDLIANRSVSNAVAETFGIEHESPQVLLIQNGECIYDASHYDISFAELTQQLQ